MSDIRFNLAMVLATIVMFCSALLANELLFRHLEFIPGVNWIYLPAGVRLLCILLFAEAGAVGLLLASWGVTFLYMFPNDFVRAFFGGIVATAAPYLVYRVSNALAGAKSSLAHLSPQRLLAYAVAYSIASPALHHLMFALQGKDKLLESFVAMVIGDLSGTLIVLYAAKGLLALVPFRASVNDVSRP